MLKKFISLTLFLTCLGVLAACASGAEKITGTIESVKVTPVGNMMEVLFILQGRPEIFMVHLGDVHKFGMSKVEKLSTSADLSRMLQEQPRVGRLS